MLDLACKDKVGSATCCNVSQQKVGPTIYLILHVKKSGSYNVLDLVCQENVGPVTCSCISEESVSCNMPSCVCQKKQGHVIYLITHVKRKDIQICCHPCQNKMNPLICSIMSIEKVKQLCRVQPVFFNNYCTLCAVLTNVCSKRVFINILK